MNIFALDDDPRLAAEYQCNKHIVKMPVETAQLLSTYLLLIGASPQGLYRCTHGGHPCQQWLHESPANVKWLIEHGLELCRQYEKWRKRVHGSEKVIRRCAAMMPADVKLSMARDHTPFALAMPDEFKLANRVLAYRYLYQAKKNWPYDGRRRPFFMRCQAA